MAGRKPGFRHNEDTRAKIKAASLINRLYDHVMADQPLLDASQVNAAKALLNKVLPDLASMSVEHSGHVESRTGMSDAELEAIASQQAKQDEPTIN